MSDVRTLPPGDPLLSVDRLTVEFPGVRALDGVSLDVRAGEVHALVGENGAGKSTLLKVLGGVQAPTSGSVRVCGNPYSPRRPSDALAAGIAVIYQEFNLFPDLTVAENVFAGREPRGRFTRGIHYAAMRAETENVFATLGVSINPSVSVSALTVPEQQLVEVAKALSCNGRIIVMDEPTAALSSEEVARLLAVVRRLRLEGCGIVYVSHRLDEVFAVADRATVLRDGQVVRSLQIKDTDEDELVRLMVGRDITSVFHRKAVEEGEVVLQMEGVSAGPMLRDIDLQVHAGEVLGIGGVAGAGQAALTQAVFGALPLRTGSMRLLGRRYQPSNPAEALAAGVGFLHEDRKAAGILPGLSVRDNLTISVLGRLRHGLARLLSASAQATAYENYRTRLSIRASGAEQEVAQLSGGNQQKVMLGRALAPGGRLLVLNEPTRGVDIGAKAEIHALVNELTANGTAVLMVSSDLSELLGMSDRVIALTSGRVSGRLAGADLTEENVVACATTGRRMGLVA